MGHEVLNRWNSCDDMLRIPKLPPGKIRKVHIYDFDNTLYNSPHPNPQLLNHELIHNVLLKADVLPNGNWWSDKRFLEASFTQSLKKPKNMSINSHWNNQIIKLAELSCADEDTITIVLTGRKEGNFKDLLQKMISEYLPDHKFNAICLKKSSDNKNGVVPSTFEYKARLIKEFMDYYQDSLLEVTIYEDRYAHVKKFSKLLSDNNTYPAHLNKRTFNWSVVPVPKNVRYLTESIEIDIIQNCIEEYNKINTNSKINLKWSPIQSGFFLTVASQRKLVAWTTYFFNRKPKLWIENFYDYPAYVPCVKRGANMDEKEIVKIWTNNDQNLLNDQTKFNEILDKFQNQSFSRDRSARCKKEFKIVEVGYVQYKTLGIKKLEQLRGSPRSIIVLYKLEPVNHTEYISTNLPYLTILGSSRNFNLKEDMIYDIITKKCSSKIVWKKTSNLNINTTFGQYSTLNIST